MAKESDVVKKRVCIACGADNKLTLEHVVPQWLSRTAEGKALIEEGFPSGPHFIWKWNDESGEIEDSERGTRISPFDTKVRAVCANCNGGWMSRLEVDFMPVFNKLRSGGQIVGEEIEIAIRWAIKTAATFQMHDLTSRVMPTLTIQPLIEQNIPLDRFVVFAFNSDDLNMQVRTRHGQLSGKLVSEEGEILDYVIDVTTIGMQGVGFVVLYLAPWSANGFGLGLGAPKFIRLREGSLIPVSLAENSSETEVDIFEEELLILLAQELGIAPSYN